MASKCLFPFAGAAVEVVAPSPDAELLQACAVAIAIDRHCDAIADAVEALPLADPRSAAVTDETMGLMHRFHAAVEQAAALPGFTAEGMRAKAELSLSYLRNDANPAEIALSLARDVLAAVDGQDAEVLAACAEFSRLHQEVRRLEVTPDTPDSLFEPVNDTLHDAVMQVSGLQARTAAGVRAKAEVARLLLAMDEPSATAGRLDVPA